MYLMKVRISMLNINYNNNNFSFDEGINLSSDKNKITFNQ